jgi:hypothetical protein
MQTRNLLAPAVVGLFLAPTLIVFHECGHYVAAVLFGLSPRLSYASVNFIPPLPESLRGVITAFGPLVELCFTLVGVVWLWCLRSNRRFTVPKTQDWLATTCVLASGRWLRCVTGTPLDPKPADEAFLSQAIGLPSWVLPYALVLVAISAIGAAIWLHPEGMRLLPFSVVFVAASVGVLLWFTTIGPWLLPVR